jgi:hypothetical protein
MKRFALMAALLVSVHTAQAGNTATLITPSFVVEIDVKCAEGNVTCDDVIYTGTSKKTGKRIRLRGKTLHTSNRGVPSQFIGYEFQSGRTSYRVTQGGQLTIALGEKVLVDEKGEWRR